MITASTNRMGLLTEKEPPEKEPPEREQAEKEQNKIKTNMEGRTHSRQKQACVLPFYGVYS